ncbi:MAG: tRNA lysidine(34) synthetase TilS [Bacteroidaceae bacterium]|nr:tRNA lysidine(34) synthetase TilS [Bacteroidaceae bacterium]
MTKELVQRVANTIEAHRLIKKGGRVLVALSGGADSVALLRCMMSLGYDCEAAHCNFHLRGKESERDETFVNKLCGQLGIKLHTRDFQTSDYASKHGISIEMAAREQRYAFFAELMEGGRYEAVAVAHHRDDNAETILLNIIRGTGLQGLTGIPYRNGDIVRPLLDAGREEILEYLRSINQDYVTDSSNLVADVKRNVVRLQLMPLLRQLNPSISDTLLTNADNARRVQDFIRKEAYNINKVEISDDTYAIEKDDIRDFILLFEIIHPLGFTPAQIADIWKNIDGQPGAIYRSATHELLRDRSQLMIRKIQKYSSLEICYSTVDISDITTIDKRPEVAYLDADKVGSDYVVRPVEQGDRFIPYGCNGSKLVSRYMIDHKFSAFQKQQQLVLCKGNDIVWLVGQRIDNRFKIDWGQTKKVLIVEVYSDKKL